MPLDWSVEAMYRALERFRSTGWDDPIGAYAAVAETLFWVDVVDEQLNLKHRPHYEMTLAEQPKDFAQMLKGLLFARNRITHEVDQVSYFLAKADGPAGFAAKWTWQSLAPRPGDKQRSLHRAYEAVIVGCDVTETLLAVTVFLGQVKSRMWQGFGGDRAT